MNKFYYDLAEAHKAEQLVLETFRSLTDKYTFVDVSGDRVYFNKGDIKAIAADGKEIMIEVKADSRIAQTGNVLCEEENYWFASGRITKGNFYSDYQIYCVLSAAERKIYVMDFQKLRQHYQSGAYREIYHADQISCCYLCSLSQVEEWGALIDVVSY